MLALVALLFLASTAHANTIIQSQDVKGSSLTLTQPLTMTGAGSYVTTGSSVIASAFFGDGNNVTNLPVVFGCVTLTAINASAVTAFTTANTAGSVAVTLTGNYPVRAELTCSGQTANGGYRINVGLYYDSSVSSFGQSSTSGLVAASDASAEGVDLSFSRGIAKNLISSGPHTFGIVFWNAASGNMTIPSNSYQSTTGAPCVLCVSEIH